MLQFPPEMASNTKTDEKKMIVSILLALSLVRLQPFTIRKMVHGTGMQKSGFRWIAGKPP
jgi:hypothetical protein